MQFKLNLNMVEKIVICPRCGQETAKRTSEYSENGMQVRTNIICSRKECNYTKFGKWM